MRKRRLLFAFILAVAIWAAIARLSIGDLGPIDGYRARTEDERAFDTAVWRRGDATARGHMLVALMQQYHFVGSHRDSVEALLGPSECYLHYEDEPCYALVLDGEPVQLEFWVNHSSRPGRVLAVSLDKQKR